MTKETLLDPHLKYAWECDECAPVIPYSAAEKAMDEWAGHLISNSQSVTTTYQIPRHILDEFAKQQAIAFANFIAHHDYKSHDIDTWNGGRKNTHEVYDDFIEYKRIEQQ